MRPSLRALRGQRWARRASWQRSAPSVWTHGVELELRPQTVFGRHACYVPPKVLNYELPDRDIPEVAVAGRSNVGKSTLVGALLGDAKLVRTSKKPGRTTTPRFFAVTCQKSDAARAAKHAACFLVDLPGVGYARRSKAERAAFMTGSAEYLAARPRSILRHALVLCDIRRGPDEDLLDAFDSLRVAHSVVFTKGDRASARDIMEALDAVEERFSRKLSSLVPVVHVVAAKTGDGVDALRAHLAAVVVPE